MSEQIREQVSAFLDGELPNSETELLLKRLTRDCELRESFGRYALIGEALRGADSAILTRGFASRVNHAIDGEPIVAHAQVQSTRQRRWWRPLASVSVAAGVAAVAIVALQQRAIAPGAHQASSTLAQNVPGARPAESPEPYTVPASAGGPRTWIAPARLTNYVLAHSKYSSGLAQRGVLADLLIEDDEPQTRASPQPLNPDVRVAP
jgi:sigma-E factor negative regulatory protein RseA